MEDVNISKYRASVVREGSKPASPGFVVSEGQSPTDPAGSGQNHLPVTIATEATGLSITDSQILSGAGTVAQYIRGDGSLADFPESSGGGSSVSYYLNGSVNQGTIGGVAYKELNKVPILGAGTDFTINANGYIASFLTDAGDPNLLEIPGGNWNFETYFSASSNGGSPTFYVELYKYDGTTFTLIASNSTFPELIAFGTNVISYFSTLAVPTTALALTDRLAIRYYVTHSGRTITLHTEDNHLCQIITTFTTGITALNGLTAQVQNFAVGTSGTDFAISSATATHTFNLPTASATNRGALSSSDWTTFNNKQNALTNPVTGTGTNNYLPKFTGLTTIGDSVIADNTNEVNISKRIFLNSGGQSIFFTPNLSGVSNRIEGSSGIPLEIFTSGSALRLGAGGSSTQINLASTGVVTMSNLAGTGSRIVVADSSGNLSASSALSGYIQGSGTTNYLPKFTAASTIGNSIVFDNGTKVGIGTASPDDILQVNQSSTSTGTGIVGPNGLTLRNTDSTAGNYTTIQNRDSNNAQNSQIQFINVTHGAPFQGAIGFTTRASTGDFAERMRITSGGNLLVGTTTDNGARLQVSGVGTFSSSIEANGIMSLSNDGTYGSTYKTLGFTGNSNGSHRIFAGTADDMYFAAATARGFQFWTNGSTATRMAITSSGNVGIGTTSPDTYSYGGTRKFLTFTATATNEEPFLQLIANGVGNSIIDFGNATIRRATIIGFDGSHLAFYTNGSNSGTSVSERMRITSGGNVLIGTSTDGGYKLDIAGKARVNNADGFFVQSGSQFRQMYFDGFNTLYFWNGSNQANLSSAGAWVNASDISIKKNIQDLNYSLSDLLNLKPKSYEMKLDNLKQIGFIAQEVEEIIPELVTTDNKGMKGLNYGNLTALLVKAIQELKQEIDTLKN